MAALGAAKPSGCCNIPGNRGGPRVNAQVGGGFPWLGAAVLVLPAVALGVGAGLVGLSGPIGLGMLGVGVAYLLVDLFVLQRRLERRAMAGSAADQAAQEFLQEALTLHSVEGVAARFGRAVEKAIGPTRALLLAPGPDGNVRMIAATGQTPAVNLGDPTAAFLWLNDADGPVSRARLTELKEFDGARATLQLIDALGCDILLPLLHRGLLLGLGLLKQPHGVYRDLTGFYSAMRAYMTVAVANTFLDAEARGRSQLARSFDLATAMQESLMPDDRPVRRDGFEVRGVFRPVAECGGDLWAWRELADGKVLLLVADATGHGAAPALLAAVAKGAIDAHWQMSLRDMDPSLLLSSLNVAVHRTGRKRYMMTAFAAVVDTRTGQLRFANAGQNFPYVIKGVYSNSPGAVEPLIARGNSLGATSEAHFENHTRALTRGDKLILYTDGIVNAGSPFIDPWGEKRFRAALSANAGQRAIRLTEIVMSEIEQYLDGRESMDDITLVAFEYGHTEGAE